MSDKKISFDSYEEMAEYYFKHVDEKPFNAYYERPGTLSLLPKVNEKNVLDAGCAAGWYTDWLLDHGAEVTALDFSPQMIEMTKRRVGNKATVIQGDLNKPIDYLNKESFDIIISSLTLHYIKDWDFVMNQFNRLLKPAGSLVFSVHHPFMDYMYFDVDDYFEVKLLEDEWNTNGKKINVEFYRRPLHKIISPVVNNGFVIEDICEPMPTEEFKRNAPETYERLKKKPQFIFVKGKKLSKD